VASIQTVQRRARNPLKIKNNSHLTFTFHPFARPAQLGGFLAESTNGRAYATVLRLSWSLCHLSVALCIVAKRCVIEQKSLLRAQGSHIRETDWYHGLNWIEQCFTCPPTYGTMGDGFYRTKDPNNSIKVLKVHIVHRQIKHTIIKQ